MSIDQMSFGSRHLADRRYDKEPARLCECGRATVNHTIRERQICKQERTQCSQ